MHTRLFFITLALSCFMASSAEAASANADLDRELSALEARYHVSIHYKYKPDAFFPGTWLNPSLALAAAPIHRQDAATLVPVLEQFLSAHPAAVIEGNLEHIYLLGRLCFRGREYGGTHAAKSMYVVWDRSRKYTPEFALERCHSEFSSILRDHHVFPSDQWQQINPVGFRYSGTGFEMLGTGGIYGSDHLEQDNGFLVRYSMSSMENDFNMISAWLFTRPNELYTLGTRHERIRLKSALAEEFYRSLSGQYAFHQTAPLPSP